MLWGMGLINYTPDWLPRWETVAENRGLNWDCAGFPYLSLKRGILPDSAEQGQKVEKPAADIKGIVLDFVAEEIRVVPAGGDTVRVEQTSRKALSEKNVMRFGMVNGELIAQSGNYDWMRRGAYNHSIVTLYLPNDFAYNVSLNTDSGKISVDGAEASGLYISTVSGGTEIRALVCDTLKIDAVSGRVVIEGAVCRSVAVDTTSGPIAFTGGAEEFQAGSLSGSVTAYIMEPVKCNMDTTSGAMRVNCEDASKLEEINFNTISGTAILELPENDGFTVDFNSISGRLESDFPLARGIYKNGRIAVIADTVSSGLNILRR